ncbi:MAG: response regulator [Clostridia bacterium]|nr:response regulator [Clostridia bacterium]
MDGTILILDYSEFEREKVKHILSNIGNFNFVELVSITEYNRYIEKTDLEPSLIIMDIAFPVEKEGFEIISSFRNNTVISKTPIIVTTKRDTLEYRNAALKLSVNDYIIKPYTANRLENSVRSLIKIEKKFTYNINNTATIIMTFEDYIIKELKIADRMKQPLSVILITSAKPKVPKSNEDSISKELREKIYSVAIEGAKLSLRSTDTAILNNSSDILVVLPGSDASGASVVIEKIKSHISEKLEQINVKFDDIFYSVSVTFPDEGKDFQSLMESAFKKISDKELLEQISSILVSTREYADKIYRRFNR